jgi:hypothetical protein
MVLNASYGTSYSYRDIAGYVIQAGLLSQRGLGTRFGVYLILESTIEGPLPVLPIYDEALDADEPWKEELRIATPDGELVEYVFPEIELRSYQTINTDMHQYHMMGFGYPLGLNPTNQSPDIPEITLKNDSDTNFRLTASVSKGTISVNDTGANAAQLLGFQALQLTGGNVGLQMISERCKDGGWLQAILDQNKDRCAQGQPVNLKFMLNGQVYDCSTDAGSQNLTGGMFYEERYGSALDFTLDNIVDVVNRAAEDSATLKTPNFQERPAFTCRKLVSDWGGSRPENTYLDYAVEICSVISNSAEAREFDWRFPRQRQ